MMVKNCFPKRNYIFYYKIQQVFHLDFKKKYLYLCLDNEKSSLVPKEAEISDRLAQS